MKRNYISVENRPDLVRDPKSGAILSINKNDIEKARRAKQLRRDTEKQQVQLREDVDNLKNELNDIKSLLTKLVEKL